MRTTRDLPLFHDVGSIRLRFSAPLTRVPQTTSSERLRVRSGSVTKPVMYPGWGTARQVVGSTPTIVGQGCPV